MEHLHVNALTVYTETVSTHSSTTTCVPGRLSGQLLTTQRMQSRRVASWPMVIDVKVDKTQNESKNCRVCINA